MLSHITPKTSAAKTLTKKNMKKIVMKQFVITESKCANDRGHTDDESDSEDFDKPYESDFIDDTEDSDGQAQNRENISINLPLYGN